jgi:hypothetical protein
MRKLVAHRSLERWAAKLGRLTVLDLCGVDRQYARRWHHVRSVVEAKPPRAGYVIIGSIQRANSDCNDSVLAPNS